MDQVILTAAQAAALAKVAQDVVILATNEDSGRIYYERAKYQGRTGEGKWLERTGRERKESAKSS